MYSDSACHSYIPIFIWISVFLYLLSLGLLIQIIPSKQTIKSSCKWFLYYFSYATPFSITDVFRVIPHPSAIEISLNECFDAWHPLYICICHKHTATKNSNKNHALPKAIFVYIWYVCHIHKMIMQNKHMPLMMILMAFGMQTSIQCFYFSRLSPYKNLFCVVWIPSWIGNLSPPLANALIKRSSKCIIIKSDRFIPQK